MNIIEQIEWIIKSRKIALEELPKNRILQASISGLEMALGVIEDGCEWQWSFAGDIWETECENATQKITNVDELPNFCPFCGRKVRLSE